MVDDIVRNYNQRVHILEQFAAFFQEKLLNSSAALEYCSSRGLTREALEMFKIGYDSGLQEFINTSNFDISLLVELGILSTEDNQEFYDKFSKRIIFPMFDIVGNIIGFSGRVWLDKDTRSKYINSNLSITYQKALNLFGLYHAIPFITKYNLALIVEGNLDVITCHMNKIPIAVGPCGTAFTEEHLMLLKNFTNRLLYCGDNDAAGRKAAERFTKITKSDTAIEVQFLELKDSQDIDKFIREYGPEPVINTINKMYNA